MLPTSTFQEIFGADFEFMLLASAVQFTGLRKVLDDTVAKSKSNIAATFFAPADTAFGMLPARLRSFLFSDPGRRALKKLLKLHIVPNTILLSDYMYDAKQHMHIRPSDLPSSMERNQINVAQRKANCDLMLMEYQYWKSLEGSFSPTSPTSAKENKTLLTYYSKSFAKVARFNGPSWEDVQSNSTVNWATLLPGYFLKIVRTQFKARNASLSYSDSLQANGVLSLVPDVITRNGVVHVVSELFHPFKPSRVYRDHCVNGDPFNGPPYVTLVDQEPKVWHCVASLWEDWEEWLEEWAMNDDD